MSRRSAAASAVVLAGAWALSAWVHPWSDQTVNDLFVYRQTAEPILEGFLPYRDFAFEYPPLAAVAIALPGLAGTGEEAYELAFGLLMLLLAGGLVALTADIASRTGGRPLRAALAVAGVPLLFGALMRTHYDLLPVVLTAGALALLCRGRVNWAFAVLGLGVMAKGFPLVVAPPALAWLAARGRRAEAVEGGAWLVAVCGAIAVAALALSPAGSADAVQYHLERPVQIESPAAFVVRGLDAVGLGETTPTDSHRSDGLLHPAGDAVGAAFALALVAVLALLTAAAARARDQRGMVLAALGAVLAFASLGKVLSPQFVIWAVPLLGLAVAWRMHLLAALLAAAMLLTFAEFPSRYFDLVDGEPFPLVLAGVRDLVLLAGLAVTMRAAGAARWSLPGRRPVPRSAQR